jgi:hypothetical protein
MKRIHSLFEDSKIDLYKSFPFYHKTQLIESQFLQGTTISSKLGFSILVGLQKFSPPNFRF